MVSARACARACALVRVRVRTAQRNADSFRCAPVARIEHGVGTRVHAYLLVGGQRHRGISHAPVRVELERMRAVRLTVGHHCARHTTHGTHVRCSECVERKEAQRLDHTGVGRGVVAVDGRERAAVGHQVGLVL